MTGATRHEEASRPSSPRHLVLLVWAFTFVAFAGTTLPSLAPVARAAGVLLFGVPVLAWAALGPRRPVDRLDVAVLIGIGAHLVVSFASLDPVASLETSATVVAYAATYAVLRATASNPLVRRALVAAVVAALLFWLAVVAATWIVEKVVELGHLGWRVTLDAHQPWVWGSVNTPPVLALLAGPFIAWLPGGTVRRVALVLWLAAAVVVIPLSVGRAAWVGIAVAAVTAEVLLGFPLLRRIGLTVRGAARFATAAAFAGVLAVALLAASGGLAPLAAALDSRARLWDQAIGVFLNDPLTGAGPSTFGWARLAHVPDYVDRVAARDVHSVPLQSLADGGLVLVAGLLLVVVAWVSLIVERWPGLDGRQRLAVAALVGFAAFALLDDLSFLPTVTVLVIVLATWSIPLPPARSARRLLPPTTVPVALVIAAIVTVPAVFGMTVARFEAAAGRDAAERADWPVALASFERAVEANPENAQLWMSVGLAAARNGQRDRAVGAYEQAMEISPGDPRPWGALAALEDDDGAAIQLLANAARRSNDPRYAYRLGDLHLRAGDEDAAAVAFAHAVTLWPDWWAVVPGQVRTDASRALPDAVATIGPIGGREPREAIWNAGLTLGRLPADARPPWHTVELASRGSLDRAMAALTQSDSSARADQAARALALLACDRPAYEGADQRLTYRPAATHPGDHPVRIGRSGLYRDLELGDYQPITGRSVPDVPDWPLGLIEVPDCGW